MLLSGLRICLSIQHVELENPAKIFLGSISRYIQTPISRKITYLFSIFVWLYKGLSMRLLNRESTALPVSHWTSHTCTVSLPQGLGVWMKQNGTIKTRPNYDVEGNQLFDTKMKTMEYSYCPKRPAKCIIPKNITDPQNSDFSNTPNRSSKRILYLPVNFAIKIPLLSGMFDFPYTCTCPGVPGQAQCGSCCCTMWYINQNNPHQLKIN